MNSWKWLGTKSNYLLAFCWRKKKQRGGATRERAINIHTWSTNSNMNTRKRKEKVTCQLNAKADEMFRTLINKYVLSVFSRRQRTSIWRKLWVLMHVFLIITTIRVKDPIKNRDRRRKQIVGYICFLSIIVRIFWGPTCFWRMCNLFIADNVGYNCFLKYFLLY
jgi:hypothetical protein